ncbi:hypothetical protein GF342_01850 [Candidatus Woesearchaeota archaeon]|nr:hypothetical protein [Candidatus Woesearchaeota archaeon]
MIAFQYKKIARISSKQIKQMQRDAASALAPLRASLKKKPYTDEFASLHLPSDKKYQQRIASLVAEKKRLGVDVLVVIGIGGSNLGSMALQEALTGKFHNELYSPKVYYADTVDPDKTADILCLVRTALEKKQRVLINCITKSGSTTETIAHLHVFFSLLKKYRSDYKKYVVFTTDKGSPLWNLAVREGFDVLEIPALVGGRYSVFSAVGQFPLGLLGSNVSKLLKGARDMRTRCLLPVLRNPAAMSAMILAAHYTRSARIHDLFMFSADLESVGKWYRQLMGESIGKEHDLLGNKVYCGMTPTVSIGSTDLHSMAQLYLGGPFDKCTAFVTVQRANNSVRVPKNSVIKGLVADIEGKTYAQVLQAIVEGTQVAYQKAKRPFIDIRLPDKSEESLGALLQLFEMQMMILGSLLNVNPFDQPSVEKYKKETRRLLRS